VNLPAVVDEEWDVEATRRVTELMARISSLAATTRAVVASGELRAPVGSPAGGQSGTQSGTPPATPSATPSGTPVG
jgi:hypothetical protein